jgi:uncharacterized metal-binding protein YceD (DUF177 family)
LGKIVTRVKLSHIPEDSPLKEFGIELPLLDLGMAEPWLGSSLSLDYELSRIYGKVLGKFKARGRLGLQCCRCLEHFERDAGAEFVVEFEEAPEDRGASRGAVDPEDPGLNVVLFNGDEIEFGEEVRQEMELQVPFAPLCKEDCKGLCPVCGSNRNERDCGGHEESRNSPFQGLKKLFQQNKEN